MRTFEHRFVSLLAIVVTLSVRGLGAEDGPGRRFDGPYHIATTGAQRIRATVKAAYHYPNLAAREWLVAYSLPPVFDGQPTARGSIRVDGAPAAEPGRIRDESVLRQPVATLHWAPESIDGAHGFTVEATYEVTINRRGLVPGEPTTPVRLLSRAERSGFLAASKHFDFTSPKFRAWLRKEDLTKKPGEGDLDFAHRAMEVMVKSYEYRFEPRSDRSASAVCKAGWSDCGGLSTVYVSILRANGIPARCLSGRILKRDETHVRTDFHAGAVGWVPADPAVAIGAHSADAGFGRERSDMIIMHFDPIRFQNQYCWTQGIGVVRSMNDEGGSAAGMAVEHKMVCEVLSKDEEP